MVTVLLGSLVVQGANQTVRGKYWSITPGKFIPTFAVKYGNTQGWPPAAEAARFDLIDVSASMPHARVHASSRGNTWQRLKHLNPHIRIFLYKNGPAIYNVASWGQLGKGWKWLIENHGVGSVDRWTAVGLKCAGCLQGTPYPNERLMNMANLNWQRYWAEQTNIKLWSGSQSMGEGADGIFADNCGYRMPWQGQWYLDGHPDKLDMPSDYTREGKHQPDLYKPHIKQFYAWAVPWLHDRGHDLVLNFGVMARQSDDWLELDREPHPPFAAMNEGAFVHPWGTLGKKGNFVFWSEREWLNEIEMMRKLKHIRALMNVHGSVISDADDFTRMDASDTSGNRAWDVLWYALTSFLQAYDDVRQNAYMNFTVWGYSRFYWFDEFDPEYLHLGRACGQYEKVAGTEGHVYLRQFEDGWVAVNPTRTDARAVAFPSGKKARVLTHDTFKQTQEQPMAERFDLPSHQGVILLKPGKQAGNQDNP